MGDPALIARTPISSSPVALPLSSLEIILITVERETFLKKKLVWFIFGDI